MIVNQSIISMTIHPNSANLSANANPPLTAFHQYPERKKAISDFRLDCQWENSHIIRITRTAKIKSRLGHLTKHKGMKKFP
jgi:hypothetical protein